MYTSSENWHDVEKYFQGCYIKIKEYGDNLVYISKVQQDGLYGHDQWENPIFIEFDGEVAGINGYEIDYVIPKRAYFQFGNRAYYLSRIPARMWKKGINKLNTTLQSLDESGFFNKEDLNFKSLMAYVNKPGYMPFQCIEEDYESIALSPRFALCSDGKLFLDSHCIGKYYLDSKTVIVKPLFYNDVKSLFSGIKIAKTS